MRKLNCRPGELAVVINSFDPVNIGSIVKVLGRDAKATDKTFMWKVHAKHLLKYAKGDKHFRRTKGSLADTDLQPIRGYPLGMDIALGVVEALDIKEGRLQVFEVDQIGTISADMPEPRTNADAFRIGNCTTADQVIAAADACPPLQFALEQALRGYKSMDDHGNSSPTTMDAEDEEDWRDWITEDQKLFTWMATFIDSWLETEVDPSDSEFFQNTSAEALALQYFRRVGYDTLEKLGVYFVEGEHPGSSFHAAVLREDVNYANQVARDLELGFRFSSAI
jgi:hypothetical protein